MHFTLRTQPSFEQQLFKTQSHAWLVAANGQHRAGVLLPFPEMGITGSHPRPQRDRHTAQCSEHGLPRFANCSWVTHVSPLCPPHPLDSISVECHQLPQHTCCPLFQPGSCGSFCMDTLPHLSNAEQVIFWGHLLCHCPWGRLCFPRTAVTSHLTQCSISNMTVRPLKCWGLSVPFESGLTLMTGEQIETLGMTSAAARQGCKGGVCNLCFMSPGCLLLQSYGHALSKPGPMVRPCTGSIRSPQGGSANSQPEPQTDV